MTLASDQSKVDRRALKHRAGRIGQAFAVSTDQVCDPFQTMDAHFGHGLPHDPGDNSKRITGQTVFLDEL